MCHAIRIDQAVFVTTGLKKYTSYEEATDSYVNESRTVTSKLQVPEHTEGRNYRYKKFGFIYLQSCSLVVSLKTTAKLGKA